MPRSLSLSSSALAASLFVVSLTVYAPAFAASGESDTVTTPTCKRSMMWDKRKKKCVRVKKSSSLDDDNIFEVARDLAYNERYDEAIAVLELANNQNDPRILNYLGYANRKLGRVEKGLTYYTAALKADPDYTLVMEYMGEAFLQLGQVDKAREQLTAIEKRCGVDCREYALLDAEIQRYLKQ